MKRIFSKRVSQPPTAHPPKPAVPSPPPSSSILHTTGLQRRDIVPPVPHPRPHDHIALLPTHDGLLLRPHFAGGMPPESHVKIHWGKVATIEELEGDVEGSKDDWSASVIVYGIIGILELYNASYLLVIHSKSHIGHCLEPTHTIYGVKGVTAIPLVEDRARTVLNVLSSKNAARHSLSAMPADAIPTLSDIASDAASESKSDERDTESSSPRVTFATEEQIKIMSPEATRETFDLPDRPPSPSSMMSGASGASTPSSEYSLSNNAPIAKTLAERLSFWNRLPKRMSYSEAPSNEEQADLKEADILESRIDDGKEEPSEVLNDILESTAPAPATLEEKHNELEQKILRQCVKDFSKGEMYFSYNFDITRSLQHKQDQITRAQKQNALLEELTGPERPSSNDHEPTAIGDKVDVMAEPSSTLPLWRRVDRQFWWNEWMSKPFIDAGLHSYVLPLIQGFFQVASFPVPREPESTEEGDAAQVDYIIMSRRSRDRAGLRYQRRGVDDDAHVANFVETETIMRLDREGVSNVFSYVQIRGSIPLYWTQSGYSLKPAPQVAPDRTPEQNIDAMRRHFSRTLPSYGPHTIVNLAEQHGKEGAVTEAYRKYVQSIDLPGVQYEEYDFHAETKGMKYENISKLIDHLERTFEQQGYFWVSDQYVLSRQKGVYRVNCIDCLDRTNVVQSAFARNVLNHQLLALALFNPSEHGRTALDIVFNDVWANNGDAISRSYAGTSALKGDFTRTGKRDLGGMLNDGMNSLARMYTSTFSDWFSQAVIDYMLGYRTISVFSEFLLKLQSTDPRDLIRLSKIRAEAIATSVSRVLQDGERLLSGWTLFAPSELNRKWGEKFEEKVLLLSVRALYIISYDYNLEKVKMYTRVPLGDITGLSKGAYILSPLEEGSRDPIQNAGFAIHWLNKNQTTRVTSYSVRNSVDVVESPNSSRPSSPLLSLSKSTTSDPLVAPKPVPTPAMNPLIAFANAFKVNPTPVQTPAIDATATSPSALDPPSTPKATTTPTTKPSIPGLSRPSTSRRPTALSRILSSAAPPPDSGETSFAAFKMLPIDPARSWRGSRFAEPADELTGAANCREAVDVVTEAIRKACEDVGAVGEGFVKEEDVVSLAEAQRMTSVYAKMEYGVKRLLWLGG